MVAEITTTLLATFNAMISGVGTGIVSLFEELILHLNCGPDGICGGVNEADDFIQLSTFGYWIFAMMGITLAIGIFSRLLNKVA